MKNFDFTIFTDIDPAQALSFVEAAAEEHPTLFIKAHNASLHSYKLYHNAMTFDLSWADPSVSADIDYSEYRQILLNRNLTKLNRLHLSIGNHIVQDRINLPVFETFVDLSQIIGEAVHAKAIVWRPARNVIGFDYFADAINRFMDGGPFPVLGFIDLQELNNDRYETHGLTYFAGYELRLQTLPDLTANMAMRIMVRLVNDIIMNGDFDDSISIPGHAENISIIFTNNKTVGEGDISTKTVEAMMIKG